MGKVPMDKLAKIGAAGLFYSEPGSARFPIRGDPGELTQQARNQFVVCYSC